MSEKPNIRDRFKFNRERRAHPEGCNQAAFEQIVGEKDTKIVALEAIVEQAWKFVRTHGGNGDPPAEYRKMKAMLEKHYGSMA